MRLEKERRDKDREEQREGWGELQMGCFGTSVATCFGTSNGEIRGRSRTPTSVPPKTRGSAQKMQQCRPKDAAVSGQKMQQCRGSGFTNLDKKCLVPPILRMA